MSLVKLNKWLRSLLVAALAFALTVAGVAFATPAQAEVTSADVFVLCDEAQDGAATVYVQNVLPAGQDYSVVRQYDNGYSTSSWVAGGGDVAVPVFGPYGQPLGNEGDDSESVTVTLVSWSAAEATDVETNVTVFDRIPLCGERPNRVPIASDSSGGGSRYDEEIVVQVLGVGDPDGDPISYSLPASPGNGSATIEPVTGALAQEYPGVQALVRYHPNGVYLGDEVFTYQVADGRGGIATATVTVTVGDSTPVGAPAPTFVEPTRAVPNGSVTLPVQAGVRYAVVAGDYASPDASGQTLAFPQGTQVNVSAHSTQSDVTLVGTKSWQRKFWYLLKVASSSASGTPYYNKVRVTNSNTFGIWFRRGDFTAPGTADDGRVWVSAGTSVYVSTARKVLDWRASASNGWVDGGRLATKQFRPKGRIVIDCRGSRRLVVFHMNNTGSTKTVLFWTHVGRSDHYQRYLKAGAKGYQKYAVRYKIRPGVRVRITATTLSGGQVTLASATVPRACR